MDFHDDDGLDAPLNATKADTSSALALVGVQAHVRRLTFAVALLATFCLIFLCVLAAASSKVSGDLKGLVGPPPACGPAGGVPGGDKLRFDGTAWSCTCDPGWGGDQCSVPPSPSPPPPSPNPPSPTPPPPPPPPPQVPPVPDCTAPGGDRLQYSAAAGWLCVCSPGWSGTNCRVPPSPPPPPPPSPPSPPPPSPRPSPPPPPVVADIAAVSTGTLLKAFSYLAYPGAGGVGTLQAYVGSFGVTESTAQTGTGPWRSSFSGNLPYLASPVRTSSFFTQYPRVRVIDGDGTSDSYDWTVFNFCQDNDSADFAGSANYCAHFGGEAAGAYSGGTSDGPGSGQVWGFTPTGGWVLLYQLPLGYATTDAYDHLNGNWFTVSGPYASTGDGKRVGYDTLNITYVGFAFRAL